MAANQTNDQSAPNYNPAVVLKHGAWVAPYKHPIKQIKTHDDLATFQKSKSMAVYLAFLEKCSQAVTGKKVSDHYPASPVRDFSLCFPSLRHCLPLPHLLLTLHFIEQKQIIDRICDVYNVLGTYIDEIPPIQQPMRYGNKAFRAWLEKVREV